MEPLVQGARVCVLHRELYETLKLNGPIRPRSARSKSLLTKLIISRIFNDDEECSKDFLNEITRKINTFTVLLHKYLTKCFHKTKILENKYKDWLSGEIHFCCKPKNSVSNISRGRPKKIFEESSGRSKLRKIGNILSDFSTEEITYAAQASLNKEGKRRAAFLVNRVASTSPKKMKYVKKLFAQSTSSLDKPTSYTADEALALMVKMNLTKEQYQIMRNSARSKGYNIYPSYNKVREIKMLCYPSKADIHITDMSATIKVQSLLDHTTHRIIQVQEEVIDAYIEDIDSDVLTFVYKWGIDGTSNQSVYKQNWLGENNTEFSDESVIILSLVPIRLFAYSCTKNDNIIFWQNLRPGSTRFCRPIKFTFEKETAEKIRFEVKLIEKQINELHSTTACIKNRVIRIEYKMLLTMVDGKVCSSITETSSQVCYICGATPKTMNYMRNEKLVVENYKFGLSTLHAWIRFFECLLHISYRLHAKKWQMRTKQDKEIFEYRKKEIQKEFRNKMALIVDQPKVVSGNSNDGNTARRFFYNPELASSITGIDINLIQRFSVILRTISSGYDIDPVKFGKYCTETAYLYNKLYSWFYMPVTVHKILYHGPEIIKSFLLPIGQLSEEAMEARNKHFRQYREQHTRKISRISTNEDLLHALLVSSDPFITSHMTEKTRKSNSLPFEITNLLSASTKNCDAISSSDSENNE